MITEVANSETIYSKLKEYLQHGDMQEIAKKHSKTQGYVTLVAQGKHKNNIILDDLVSKAEDRKAERLAISKRITEL